MLELRKRLGIDYSAIAERARIQADEERARRAADPERTMRRGVAHQALKGRAFQMAWRCAGRSMAQTVAQRSKLTDSAVKIVGLPDQLLAIDAGRYRRPG